MIYGANNDIIANVADELMSKKKKIMDEINNKITEDLYGPTGDIYVVQDGHEERRAGRNCEPP